MSAEDRATLLALLEAARCLADCLSADGELGPQQVIDLQRLLGDAQRMLS